MPKRSAFIQLIIVGIVNLTSCHDHGGVPMGEDEYCDTGRYKLEVDWDSSSDYEYTCQKDEQVLLNMNENHAKNNDFQICEKCLVAGKIPVPYHICMSDEIKYDDTLPTAGPHRPVWPKYGEYKYLPPQRWLHTLEHGGIVFLYHPCADKDQIKLLKKIAKCCLRKHVISAYRKLAPNTPYAVLSYGCKMVMSKVVEHAVKDFVKRRALHAPETRRLTDGRYVQFLKEAAEVVSDRRDSILCPRNAKCNVTDENKEEE